MDLNLMKRSLTEKEASQYIGMSVGYLQKDRSEGKIKTRTPGPKFLKIGKSVRYLKEELDQWLEAHCK